MARTLIFSLLLAAFLGQGWARATMAEPAEPAAPSECGGHPDSGATGDCCPDGAAGMNACASVCAAAFALAASAPEVASSREAFHSLVLPAFHAGPRYHPLNPPPIA